MDGVPRRVIAAAGDTHLVGALLGVIAAMLIVDSFSKDENQVFLAGLD